MSITNAFPYLKNAVDARNGDSVRKQLVGKEIRPDVFIIDANMSVAGDVLITCFLPTNVVHKFVTWFYDIERGATANGDYCFTVIQATESMFRRLGIKPDDS